MRILYVLLMLILCSCIYQNRGGFTQEVFLQDPQNMAKYAELSAKRNWGPDCDKIQRLIDFYSLESPTVKDLAKIMPLVGAKENDANNIDKVYSLDLSVLHEYECNDYHTDLRRESKKYCDDKYSRKADRASCYKYMSEAAYYVYDYKPIRVYDAITKIYPMPGERFLAEFKPSELISANNTVLGTYDGDCYAPLCDDNTNNITRLNVATMLRNHCWKKNLYARPECECFAHVAYKNVSYKNVIYIFEKDEWPHSKEAEFNKLLKKCREQVYKKDIEADKARYGETNIK